VAGENEETSNFNQKIHIENFAAEDPESLVAEKNENELISEITNWPRH
jgi:hypothetical protein